MATKLFVLSALVLLSVVAARVPRDAPKEDFFADFFNNAKLLLDDAHETVLKVVGVENDEQLQQKAVESGNTFAGKLDVWTKDIKSLTESLKDNEHVKALREEVDKHIEEFKLTNPGTTADVKAFADKAQKGADDILTKLKSLKDSEEAKNFQDLTKSLGEKTLEVFKDVPNKLKA